MPETVNILCAIAGVGGEGGGKGVESGGKGGGEEGVESGEKGGGSRRWEKGWG